ncbi:Cryptochrome/photolyase FAD-binding domain-containing protein [Cystobasidium minutum MCA 4210]|uniref:Cryptochrome/photolyase FAD-binding domain-containing protein n=1 Tax=Cystobasidium minutum MCA 4210 TaxID=1397322 RepID=UPI0034CF5EB7|eukprot:jgi/Rhomi1/146622/e_gw1.6.543.1
MTEIYNNEDNILQHPSRKRAREIDEHVPMDELEDILGENKSPEKAKNILHWFRSKDIRQEDNIALNAAYEKAQESDGILITAYLHSPEDLEWHGTSPARCAFMTESLRILQTQLQEKYIPLYFITADKRSDKTDSIVKFIKDNDISHVFANYEYEVDELRRDMSVAKRLQEEKVAFELFHDQTVVAPRSIAPASGKPHRVFTPYHKAWLVHVAENPDLLNLVGAPEGNDKAAADKHKKLFESKVPPVPDCQSFKSDEDKKRITGLWPPGNEAGMKRLDDFLENKVSSYRENRSRPDLDPSSRLSPYISSGVVSVRQLLAKAKEFNNGEENFDNGDSGVSSWVREIVFREFYRQMTVVLPHGAMNLPQNIKFDKVQWEEDEEGWKKWCEGKTGVPFVDAGMRQLASEGYMHNRLRMNVSSYLSANLLIDYRKGERFFVENLVDWDLSNNTNGWEPSYTVFNPVVQAEKCDPHGDYIRKWVPELRDVEGKAIFAPHDRLSKEEFEKLGYPAPHVDFSETKARAVERYKHDLHTAEDE